MTKETVNKKEEKIIKDVEATDNEQSKAQKTAKDVKKESSTKKKKIRKAKKTATELVEDEKAKYAELNDKYIRLFSEFDNFRKRSIKERLELTKSASQDVIISILPVIDDFERAIQAFEDTKAESLKEGINLIYNKFKSTLNSKGVECMESKGKEFDTDFHEALTQIPAPSKDLKGKVVDVIEKGYTMNGKVIRFAKVVVGK